MVDAATPTHDAQAYTPPRPPRSTLSVTLPSSNPASEALLAQVIDNITEGFVTVDTAWRVTFANRMAEQVVGRSREYLMGRSIWEEFPDAFGTRFETEFKRVAQQAVSVTFVEYFAPFHAWFEMRVIPIPDGMSFYFRDVTALRDAERLLQEAKDDAEKANRAKTEYLTRISRELRAPLNSLIGFGTLLHAQLTDPKDLEFCDHLLRAGSQMQRLVNDVADFTRVESGETSLSLEPVSVKALMEHVVSMVDREAKDRGIALNVGSVLQSSAVVWGDFQRLTQIMFHLVDNAIRFNRPTGSVTVTCESHSLQRLRLVVADTGPGLTTDQLDRIWTPFARFDGASEPRQLREYGTGMGLSMTRGLVRRLGGNIGVDSKVNVGSRFWVELSAFAALAPPYVIEPTPQPKRGPGNTSIETFSVLYVEDNWSNYRLVEHIFEQRPNITLYSASEGTAALNLAHRLHPNLILLDLHLPDMRGDELLDLLQAQGLGNIPVVVVTADVARVQARDLLKKGAKAFLTKPIEVLAFLEVVDAVLEGREIRTR